MKTSIELVAEFRDDQGKGASRRLRRSGKVPAILYGGHEQARPLQLEHDKLLQMLDNEKFYSTILSLSVGREKQPAVLKDLQRHPFKNQVLHIDFQRVLENEQIRMKVPLHFVNESVSVGVKQQGGTVSHLRNEVEVLCLPKDLPEYIEVDLLELGLGQLVHLSELRLPEGVQLPELIHGHDAPVVSIHTQRAEAVTEEAPVETAVAAAPAAGAAAEPEAAKK
ncbi:MAG: 50S ribosomal protein L25 [Gammaproteobacteria bacterium SG8_30]|jgi:large subunit ribosomal protein L25|nr:MAG: 50S ribosomal protein L25 [Gammaproteobacteria bacterium SG8_30]